MERQKVYWMDDRSFSLETSMVAKMLTVFDAAELGKIINKHDIVAIKVHCGEYNTTHNLRPQYIRALADKIKELGGRPFVCDTTTLPYAHFATRVTELDELLTAERNGLTPAALGCPFIVADGFFGLDEVLIDLPEGLILKEQYIARALAMADAIIVLTHFKGHPMGVIGGSIKNIGIGATSKRGKLNAHLGGHKRYGFEKAPFNPQLCIGEGCPSAHICNAACPYGLIKITKNGIEWEKEKCTGCLCHLASLDCGVLGYQENFFDATTIAIADSALACVKAVNKKIGYINLALDIAPNCDCAGFSDRPIMPNLGVFASLDPVAVDLACVDKAAEAMGIPGSESQNKGIMEPGHRGKFSGVSSLVGASEEMQLRAGAKNGLGNMDYELIQVDPQPSENFLFQFDKRFISVKYKRMFQQEPIYPTQEFKRIDDIDDLIEKLKSEQFIEQMEVKE